MRYALLSVSYKTGLAAFAQGLAAQGFTLLSTGGTFRHLQEQGLEAIELSQFTGHPEMLDGRVKTLHPRVHAGLLYNRQIPEHVQAMEKMGYGAIDVVAVNLYPFEATVAKADCTFEEAVENIDIGGPSMIRSAAKNHQSVYVVTDPADYGTVLDALNDPGPDGGLGLRRLLALKVYQHTAAYDAAISRYLQSRVPEAPVLPQRFGLGLTLHMGLRYGENPHQQAAFYALPTPAGAISFARMAQHQGKELSFNNLLDLNAALLLSLEIKNPCAVVIKHTNPTGVATHVSLLQAYINARDVDPEAAFGSIMAFNRPVTVDLAQELAKTFIEAVIAPGFEPQALAVLSASKKHQRIRLLDYAGSERLAGALDVKPVAGGLLVQTPDNVLFEGKPQSVGGREPTPTELENLYLAWAVVKHVKSNAIVLAKDGATVGTGAGQMSRVASLKNALEVAAHRAKGAVLASDAFFPFRDSIDLAARHGVTAIIQPGGSIRDEEVIQAAKDADIAMLFTGMRHFRH